MKTKRKAYLKNILKVVTIFVIMFQLIFFPTRFIIAAELQITPPETKPLQETQSVKITRETKETKIPLIPTDITTITTEVQPEENPVTVNQTSDPYEVITLGQNPSTSGNSSLLNSGAQQIDLDAPLTTYNDAINSNSESIQITDTSPTENASAAATETNDNSTSNEENINTSIEYTPNDNIPNENNISANSSSDTNGASNINTGSDSTNSSTTNNDVATEINNEGNVSVDQTVDVTNETGQNNVVYINGNTEVVSGDINESVNLITTANTNINGTSAPVDTISLDITGTVEGDIDLGNLGAMDLQEGNNFLNGNLVSTNENTGFDSENTAITDESNSSTVNNFNNADLSNDLDILLSTGDNSTQNINGDSTVESGDINLAANVVNFVNTSITTIGNIVVGVIDIFGTLIGDIILPDSPIATDSTQNTSATSSNNNTGANSENNASSTNNSTTAITNNNDLTIANDFNIAADTGNNSANSINGDTEIVTGDIYAESNAVNIGNSNTVSTDSSNQSFWLVLINNLGTWTGEILGLDSSGNPSNSILAYQFTDADLASLNENTGVNSVNNASSTSNTENTITNNNEANVDNSLNINATTGGNSFNYNNGNNFLETGDINILANVLNIMNYNFVGNSWGLLIVNVFGSWMGNLVGPDYEYPVAEADNNNPPEPSLIPDIFSPTLPTDNSNTISEAVVVTTDSNNQITDKEVPNVLDQQQITQEPETPTETIKGNYTTKNSVASTQNESLNNPLKPEPTIQLAIANNSLGTISTNEINQDTERAETDVFEKTQMSTLYEVGNNKNENNILLDFLKGWSPFALIGIMGIVLKKRIFNP